MMEALSAQLRRFMWIDYIEMKVSSINLMRLRRMDMKRSGPWKLKSINVCWHDSYISQYVLGKNFTDCDEHASHFVTKQNHK